MLLHHLDDAHRIDRRVRLELQPDRASLASILTMPSGFAASRSRCVSTSACACGGSLPKRSISSSWMPSIASPCSQFASRL
jgi:hypothetical protein